MNAGSHQRGCLVIQEKDDKDLRLGRLLLVQRKENGALRNASMEASAVVQGELEGLGS